MSHEAEMPPLKKHPLWDWPSRLPGHKAHRSEFDRYRWSVHSHRGYYYRHNRCSHNPRSNNNRHTDYI